MRDKSFFALFVLLALSLTMLYAEISNDTSAKLSKLGVTVDSETIKSDGELITLIVNTDSMDDAERKDWLVGLSSLADEQKERLLTILKDEKRKLDELDKNFTKEQKELSLKHAKEKIEKIHELLAVKKYKLDEEEINVGIDAVQTYMDDESEKSRNLLAKAAYILEYAIKNTALGNTQKAAFHYWASDVYMRYPMPEKMNERIFHVTQSIMYLKKMYAAKGEADTKNTISLLLGSLSYLQVCKKDFVGAIKSADEAVLTSREHETDAVINKAHALMFMGHEAKAKELYKKVLASDKKDEAIKAISADIKEFEHLKFPSDKIKAIREMTSYEQTPRDKAISTFKAKIESVKKTQNEKLLNKMQETLKCYEDRAAVPDSKIGICENIFLNEKDHELLKNIN